MSRPRKKIKLQCYSPLTEGYSCSWEDIWITMFVGKRKRVCLGPCLSGMSYLEYEIKRHTELRNETPEEAKAFHESMPELFKDSLPDFRVDPKVWQEDIDRDQAIVDELKTSKFVLREYNRPTIPDIYTSHQLLTKELAEEMMEWWLRLKGYLKPGVEPRFQWPNPGGFVVWPTP